MRQISIKSVEVEVTGDFGGKGDPASNIKYSARIVGDASEEALQELMQVTDSVAEIQNTLRAGADVILSHAEVVPG